MWNSSRLSKTLIFKQVNQCYRTCVTEHPLIHPLSSFDLDLHLFNGLLWEQFSVWGSTPTVKGDIRLDGHDCSFTNLHVLSWSLKIAHTSRKLQEHINKAANWPIISQVLHLILSTIHVWLLIVRSFQFSYASVQFWRSKSLWLIIHDPLLSF